MALDTSPTVEMSVSEGAEMKASEPISEPKSERLGPLYLLCRSGEVPCSKGY